MSASQIVIGSIVIGASLLVLLFFLALVFWPSKPAEPDAETKRFVECRAARVQMSSDEYIARYYPER